MVVRRRRTMVLVGASLTLPGHVLRAQTDFYATGTGQIAYTDNLFSESSTPAPGQPGRLAAWYLTLTPGAGVYHDSNRARYLLNYSHGFTFYWGHTGADANSDLASAQGIFLLSPREELTLSLAGSRTTTVQLLNDPLAIGQAQLNGRVVLLSLGVDEMLSRDYSVHWSGHQSAAFRVFQPLYDVVPQPLRFSVTVGAGAEYRYRHDAWGFDLIGNYYDSVPRHDVAPFRYFTVGPVVLWRHDLSREWATELRGGLQAAFWLQPTSLPSLYPLWSASLNWRRDPAFAVLTYTGQVAPNLYTNQAYFTEMVSLTGRVRIAQKSRIDVFSTSRFTSNRLVSGQTGEPNFTLYAWGADLGIGWFPENLPQVDLSYQHAEQLMATSGAFTASGFYRNQIALTVQGRFPAFEPGAIPTARPLRVDEADRPRGAPSLEPAPNSPDEEAVGSPAADGRPAAPEAAPPLEPDTAGPPDRHP